MERFVGVNPAGIAPPCQSLGSEHIHGGSQRSVAESFDGVGPSSGGDPLHELIQVAHVSRSFRVIGGSLGGGLLGNACDGASRT
jgi:hypothetical protein